MLVRLDIRDIRDRTAPGLAAPQPQIVGLPGRAGIQYAGWRVRGSISRRNDHLDNRAQVEHRLRSQSVPDHVDLRLVPSGREIEDRIFARRAIGVGFGRENERIQTTRNRLARKLEVVELGDRLRRHRHRGKRSIRPGSWRHSRSASTA